MNESSDKSMFSAAEDSAVPAAEPISAGPDPLQEERRLTQTNLTKVRSRIRRLQEEFADLQAKDSSVEGGQGSETSTFLLQTLQAAEGRESKHAHKLTSIEAALAANAHMDTCRLGETRYQSVEDYHVRSTILIKAAEDDWKAQMQEIWETKPQDGVDITASQGSIRLCSEDRLYEYVPHNLVVAIRHANATLTEAQLEFLTRMSPDDYTIFRS